MDRLSAIAPESWDALAGASVFQTHAWHRAWWDVYGRDQELCLWAATDGGELCAAAPMVRDGSGVMRFIGGHHADYQDLLVAPDKTAAVPQLWRALSGDAGWKRAELVHLPARGPLFSWLRRHSADNGLHPWVGREVLCPRLDLRDPAVAREKTSKKSLRRHVEYFRRQAGYRVEHLGDASAIEPHLDAFFAMHMARWDATATRSQFHRSDERAFYRALVRQLDGTGTLCFTRLALGDRPVAFHLGFVSGGTFTWYKPAFDPELARRSPGEALLKELLDLALACRCHTFDFTVGAEAFKLRFATSTPSNYDVTVYRRRGEHTARLVRERVKAAIRNHPAGARLLANVKRWRAQLAR